MKNFFASRWGIIVAGLAIGVIASVLQKLGNPSNMGLCMACFERDIAGALGFHQAGVVQYVRPEIIGIIIGSFVTSIFFKEFKPRSGSSPIIRFFLGVFAMIGALVFLGCPWRAFLRLAGGDWNAIIGIVGLAFGVGIGVIFLRSGFNLGRSYSSRSRFSGWVFPIVTVIIFIFFLLKLPFIHFSEKGPGSQYAPIAISLIAGLVIGFLANRSRFCTMGSIRDVILIRDFHLLSGVLAFTVAALIMNFIFGQFHPGFANPPIGHTDGLWNFLGMTLAGLAFALAGGCPGRQLILAGEGNGDSTVFVLGMLAGAGFAHNFSLASSPKGIGTYGAQATILGLIFCVVIGLFMIERRKA